MAEGALDQTFMTTVATMAGIPRSSQLRRICSELVDARRMFERRGWLDNPAGYHREPPPLDQFSTTRKRAWAMGTTIDYTHLRFDSDYRPHPDEPGCRRWLDYEENRSGHAFILEHKGKARPWLVCVHAFGMGTPLMNFHGFDANWLHKELGLNLLFPVLPLHGPRKPGFFSGGELVSIDYINALHGFAQAAWDLRRMVSWLRDRGAETIGMYGLSLGGYNSAVICALQDDLDCVIAGIPAVDFTSLARDNENWITRSRRDAAGLDWQLIDDVMGVVAPLKLKPKVTRDKLFIFAGLADRMAPPSQARSLWRHWGRPAIHWYEGGHVAFQWTPSIKPFVRSSLERSGLVQAGGPA